MSGRRVGDRLCTAWVRWYTRRIPADIAAERQREIASDLWEHRCDAAARGRGRAHHDVDVIGRVVSGIPADLSWRRRVLQSQARPDRGVLPMPSRAASFAKLLLTVFTVVGLGIAATPLPWAAAFFEGVDVGGVLWLLATLALAVPLLVGLMRHLGGTAPSTMLLVIGSPAPSVAWFWLPPVYLLTVAIAVTALVTRRRRTDLAAGIEVPP